MSLTTLYGSFWWIPRQTPRGLVSGPPLQLRLARSLRINCIARRLLSKLSSELSPEQIAQWPVMFRGEQGSLTGNESKMRYQEFLKNLKEVCRLLGYDEDMLGTHSLRRGSVTDQFRFGIPDQVIKTSDRWKSAAFSRYIDQEMSLSFHMRAIQASKKL